MNNQESEIKKEVYKIEEEFKNSPNFFKLILYEKAFHPRFKKSTGSKFEEIWRYFFKPHRIQKCIDYHSEWMFYHSGIFHDKGYCLKCKTQWSEHVDGAY